VALTWQHADELRGGSGGHYMLELYRRVPGEDEQLLTSIAADATPAQGGRAANRTGNFSYTDSTSPIGSAYRVVVIDPLGRTSAPSADITP
jgi:hypothetical protein